MTRWVFLGVGTLAAGLAIVAWRVAESSTSETLFEVKTKPPEAAPLCPWRQPEADMKALFPNATRYEAETRILSGQRTEMAERLGRTPTGDENALHFYRIYRYKTVLGTVLTRRVKGDYGAIELVLGTDVEGRVCGMRLQRLREPESVASVLQNQQWEHSFEGKSASNAWQIGRDLPDVPVEARTSAQALAEGARSLLIQLAAANSAPSQRVVVGPHH